MTAWFRKKKRPAEPPAPRPLLTGEITVSARAWTVREERRQGPRPQLFVLTALDDEASQMHVRPLPGVILTTLEEVADHAPDASLRWFTHVDGTRWEVRPIQADGVGTVSGLKFISWTHGVFEGSSDPPDPLGRLSDAMLRDTLRALQNHAPE